MMGCGPGLPPADSSATESATAGSGTGGSDSGDSAGGSVAEPSPTDGATAGSGTGDGEPPMPVMPEACALVRVEGDARVPIDADSISALRLSVLDPGDPRTPARVMTIQDETFGSAHSNYRARSFVLESWPDGVLETRPSLPLTRAGHGASRLARLAGAPNRFAYLWTGDPDGTNQYDTFFSILDGDAWSVGGEVEVLPGTNPLFVDLLPSASSARLVSTYTTDTFDSTPKDQFSGFSLGILAADGAPITTATPLTARTPGSESAVRTFWAGDRVAVAMGHNACAGDDALCSPHAVVLARPTAPDEHGVAVDGFEVTHVIDGLAGTQHVSRPQVANELGLTWMSWYEGEDSSASDEHRTLRGLVLDASGDPLPWPLGDPKPGPIDFMVDTDMGSWPSLLVSELGITVVYRTHESTFEVHHHDFTFTPIGEPIVLELDSSLSQYPSMSLLGHPRSLLLAWGEQVREDVSIRMVRLECGEA